MPMTKADLHPWDTPSEREMSISNVPEVKRNAPIQSTPDARGESSGCSFLAGSFGIAKNAVTPVSSDAPAMTKKTTFQLVYCEIIPPYIQVSKL